MFLSIRMDMELSPHRFNNFLGCIVEIVGRYGGLVRDEAITQRVMLVGRSLARYSDRPGLDWRFGVLDSPTVNAFSAPDGYVFITRGLYDLAENDDVLAAILSHEIAHITGRHALKIVARGEFLSGATSLAAARSGDRIEQAHGHEVARLHQCLAQAHRSDEPAIGVLRAPVLTVTHAEQHGCIQHDGGGIDEGVADDAFAVAFFAESAQGYAGLFAAHY
mgnify:CR=1 FL=1